MVRSEAQVFPDPIEDDHRVIDGVSNDGKQCCDKDLVNLKRQTKCVSDTESRNSKQSIMCSSDDRALY